MTSRERLNLLSEWVFDLQGLPVPLNAQVEQFEAYSSVALFLQSARRVHAGFSNARPNANLDPERSHTWGLPFSYAVSRNLQLGLSLYHFLQSDFIAADASNRFQYMGNHRTRGIELEAQWQATKTLRVSGNLSHREQDDTPYRYYFAPDKEAYLRADWGFHPKWNWNLKANWTGKRPRPSNDPRQTLGTDTVVDTTIRYLHGKDWEFSASIRNLFDEDAREYTTRSIPNDLPLPGRSFYAETRFKL